MFLSEVNIWNFRKYGSENSERPNLSVKFNSGLNLIIGENDSGKTTIIDAIKIVLGTQSYDNVRIDENDFYKDNDNNRVNWLKIECVFQKLNDLECGRFLEWIEINEAGDPKLEVRIVARIKDNKIIVKKTAGRDGLDIAFDASENLRCTYLKPLRDAENELSPGYKSRFAQVLKSHPLFIVNNKDSKHPLEQLMKDANDQIENYFKPISLEEEKHDIKEESQNASAIIESINITLEQFFGSEKDNYNVKVNISNMELNKILTRLMLIINEDKVGLGTLNQLYIAMELLLLEVKDKNNDFGLALIEEIEAHLHPQAQLRVIKHLEENINSQTILTTHSNTLASVVKVENSIICRDGSAFSLNNEHTGLSLGDYEFLERFLDSTKANLFFAKGVIFVEGDAENLLIPSIAEVIGLPLYKYGVSVVNVGSVAFLRYSNIFISKDRQSTIGIPTSIVTDLDVRPPNYYNDIGEVHKYTLYKLKNEGMIFTKVAEAERALRQKLNLKRLSTMLKEDNIENIEDDYEQYKVAKRLEKISKYDFKDINVFTNTWTMEFDLALSCLKVYLYAAVLIAKDIHNDEEIIDYIKSEYYIEKAKAEFEQEFKGKSDIEIAYLVYKPLLKNNCSKAVCAQYLSRILINECQKNKGLIEEIVKDEYISYIIKAIYHATNTRM